jgi:hypothetical protein
LERDGRVNTEIVSNCTKGTAASGNTGAYSAQYDEPLGRLAWLDGLVSIGFDRHFRVNNIANEFARDEYHINGIESFWSYAKGRVQKSNGISAAIFSLYLKETEFRFNHRHDNLYLELVRLLRLHPL